MRSITVALSRKKTKRDDQDATDRGAKFCNSYHSRRRASNTPPPRPPSHIIVFAAAQSARIEYSGPLPQTIRCYGPKCNETSGYGGNILVGRVRFRLAVSMALPPANIALRPTVSFRLAHHCFS